jgi:flagellar protein FlbD
MILLRRLNNAVIGLNADLIERIDSTPDTVITLVDGKKYVVADTPEEVVERIVAFRANVLLNVGPQGSLGTPAAARPGDAGARPLRLVSDPERPQPDSAATASATAAAVIDAAEDDGAPRTSSRGTSTGASGRES